MAKYTYNKIKYTWNKHKIEREIEREQNLAK